METDVHFPTDINLLLDAIRKTIDTAAGLADQNDLPGWRQSAYHQRRFKKQYRKVQRLKHSTSSNEKKKELKAQEIRDAHRVYLDMAENYLARAELTRQQSPADCLVTVILRAGTGGIYGTCTAPDRSD